MKINEKKYRKLQLSKENKKLSLNKCLSNIQTFLIIIFIILLFNIIISKILKIKNKSKNLIPTKTDKEKLKYNFHRNISEIVKDYTLGDILPDTLNELTDYMDKARNRILLNKSNLIKSENPKVSVIISLYNREDYVYSTIRSVQNQNITDLEIIIVDDCSTDNSLKYAKEIQKEDPRIVVLENKINMGSLYSKSIGVLNARGKYSHSLDSDDMFCNEAYLDTTYEEAIKDDSDYVDSKALYLNERSKSIVKQRPFWVVLWSKLVKTKIYKHSIYKVGKDIMENKVVIFDDDIIASYLFRGKKKKLSIIGVCHFIHHGYHVYSTEFKSKTDVEIYCKNIVNAIDGLYKMKLESKRHFGIYLLHHMILGGTCKHHSNSSQIQKILLKIENETQNKNKTNNFSKIL